MSSHPHHKHQHQQQAQHVGAAHPSYRHGMQQQQQHMAQQMTMQQQLTSQVLQPHQQQQQQQHQRQHHAAHGHHSSAQPNNHGGGSGHSAHSMSSQMSATSAASAASGSSSSKGHGPPAMTPQEKDRYVEKFDFMYCAKVEKYEKLTKVGQGTFGEVFKARLRSDKTKIVALKKILMDNEKEGFPITALREIRILQLLNHENIINLIEICRQFGRHNKTMFYLVSLKNIH